MTKNEAIKIINQNVKTNELNIKNTHYSNIVKYSNNDGWWINIPFKKFIKDVNLILNNTKDSRFTHIKIEANSIINPESIFRDKKGLADIFIPLEKEEKYVDKQYSGTNYNFKEFSIYQYSKKSRYTKDELILLSNEVFKIYIDKYNKNENLQYSIIQPSSNKKIIHTTASKIPMSNGTAENYSERLFNLWNKLNNFNIKNGLEGCPKLLEEVGTEIFDKKYFLKENILNLITIEKTLEDELKKSQKDTHENRQKRLNNTDKKPPKIEIVSTQYKRNPDVIIEVLSRANGICEKCKRPAPFIRKKDKTPYLEVHHIIKLADNGDDTVDNAIAVCPNCHRELHYA